MRIIAGTFRSRKLITLDGLKTRPTLDKTKEAIFSSMGNYFPGATVLDIFGGSGALALESISRGAQKAYIIDANPAAIQIIKQNAANLGVKDELVVFQGEYQQIMKHLFQMQFDIIFLDPPFRMKVIDELIELLIQHNMIALGGYIMAEYPEADQVKKDYLGYAVHLCKRYSSSEVLLLKRIE